MQGLVDPTVLPIVLAVTAACLFGLCSISAKRGLAHVDAQTGSLVSIGTSMVWYALGAPFWMHASDWFNVGFWIFVLNGLMHPLLSMYLSLEATARTGPTVAATFSSTSPLFATLTAVVFLHESVSIVVALGTLGTVVGVATLSWAPGGVSKLVKAALLFASGAAVIRGLSHTMGAWGLGYLPNVFMAGFVSFGVSLVGSVVIYRLHRGELPRAIPRIGMGYFVVTGTLIAFAILCMYGALGSGPVVVVSPIIASYPLFTLLGALVLGQERISLKLSLGVLMVVGGVTLISVGTR